MTSARASGKVLPWSRVMSARQLLAVRQSSSRKRKKTWLRAMSGMSRQAGKAALAAATAASTSACAAARDAGDHLRRWPGCRSARSARGGPRPAGRRSSGRGWGRVAAGAMSVVMSGDASSGALRRDARVRRAGRGRRAEPVSVQLYPSLATRPGRARSGRRVVALPDGPVAAAWRPGRGRGARDARCGRIGLWCNWATIPGPTSRPQKVPAPRSAGSTHEFRPFRGSPPGCGPIRRDRTSTVPVTACRVRRPER